MLIIHLNDTGNLPLKNIAKECNCSESTIRRVLKTKEDYSRDGPLLWQCNETEQRMRFATHPCKFAGKAGFAAVPCENLFWLIRRFEEEARDIEGTVAIP